MTRSMILAILAFGCLMVLNLTVFGLLSFGNLSEKMVTEKLMEGLNEARRILSQQASDARGDDLAQSLSFSKRMAPRLQRFAYFRAVLVLDRRGRVIHREEISRVVRWQSSASPNARSDSVRFIPVQYESESQPSQPTRFALEYDAETIKDEVEALRRELNKKLSIAIFVSVLLLVAGLAYVIWAYRRNQFLQGQARKADRLAYVGTLASGLAHEIRNPLNSMNMNVQLILEELEERGLGSEHEVLDLLEGTRREVHRLEQMVSSFLAYARPTRLVVKPTQINQLIEETMHFLGPEVEKKGIKLQTKLSAELPVISVDENQLKQALINVIQNALQVLSPGGRLEIQTRKAAGDKVLIAIRDEGPGISKEELKHIFKVFYSTRQGGTGLGLPIAQRIAELHDGGLKVESEVGKGTTITFILPMDPSP